MGGGEVAHSRAPRCCPGNGKVAVAQESGTVARKFAPAAVGIVALVSWEFVSRAGLIDPFFLPAPSAIVARLVTDLVSTPLPSFLATTLFEALAGALLGALVAIPLGYWIAKSPTAARIIEPYAAASQAIPAIALAPLLVLWIGRGFLPIVILSALIAFFPIMLGTTLGLRQLPTSVVDAARLDGAGAWDLLIHIEAPLALPSLLTGVRNGLTLSFTGAIVGEFTMGGRGLGMALDMHRRNGDTTALFATLVLLASFAVLSYGLMRSIERKVAGQW